MPDRTRKGFWFTGLAILLALTEALSFVFGHFFAPEMFSREDGYFAAINRVRYEEWRASPWFDPKLGWNLPRKQGTESKENCLGQMISYSYQNEHRGAPRPGTAAVALFGDSYTYGEEVDDNSTSSAALERLINAPVLNFGVPGFSPEQAVLKFELLAKRIELPKVAVLIIMHENIRRVVNSFRPVYVTFDTNFGLKPYVDGNSLVEMPAIANYDEFLTEARRRFELDFWARPRFVFPYSISLFRAATSNAFFVNKVASYGRPEMTYEYEWDNSLRRALTATIDRWRSSVSAKAVRPFVLFIPAAPNDKGVSAQYVESLNASAGQVFAFEFDDPTMDWHRYKLKPKGGCHPTPYGNERIAAFIASHIMTSPLLTAGK